MRGLFTHAAGHDAARPLGMTHGSGWNFVDLFIVLISQKAFSGLCCDGNNRLLHWPDKMLVKNVHFYFVFDFP